MDGTWAISAVWAAAVGGLALAVISWAGRPRRADLGYFELQRRDRLRQASTVYRWCEPMIDDLAPLCAPEPAVAARMQRELIQAGRTDWQPAEIRAALGIEGLALSALLGIPAGIAAHPLLGAMICVVGTAAYVAMQLNQITAAARLRAQQCRLRLPFVVDLLALMMEAGATFLEALGTVVQENPGHPLADEFRVTLNAIEQGISRHQALRDLDERLNDEAAHEMMTAIIHGEELGTPLSQILRSQSDLMRLKRSQYAEKAIAEAQVQMSFPGLLIMVACMIIIIMPFLLRAASVSMF